MSRLQEEHSIRKSKRDTAKTKGIDPYPARVKRTHSISELLDDFTKIEKKSSSVTIVGRIRSIRLHGGSCFTHIEDGSGKIQVYLKKDTIGSEMFTTFKELVDIGDFIECTGKVFVTKRGERTVLLTEFQLITKSLLPLPEKWHGLSDTEIRFRKRYLDLIVNEAVRSTFIKRSVIIQSIRQFLDRAGFIEVETPILQQIPGGANAQPFITHHNSLDIDLYLRIAPELYLKRLIVGGFERVYEVARCFRNEGIDRDHNPEFTQVELYAAYWDYEALMKFTEKLIKETVQKTNGKLEIVYENNTINFTDAFERTTFKNACKKYGKIDIEQKDIRALLADARKHGCDIEDSASRAKIFDEIFKELVRPQLIQPTYVTDYPIELSPLAKKKPDNENYVERFQLVVGRIELCNAFSELNDPVDQEERFKEQEKMRAAGDDEAQRIDRDYVEALSYGMPPTAGIGIGIDRLAALLTDTHNIKEVILFPTLKPKETDNG